MSDWIRKRSGDKDSPERQPVERARPFKGNLQDMLAWCSENDIEPSQVEFTGQSHLAYPSIETEAERDARLAAVEKERQRHAQWERDMYDKLHAKFASGDTTGEQQQ
jgi:hypothetical protein